MIKVIIDTMSGVSDIKEIDYTIEKLHRLIVLLKIHKLTLLDLKEAEKANGQK